MGVVGGLLGEIDGDIVEPGVLQASAVFADRQGSGDAPDPAAALGAFGLREMVFGDHVGDPHPPAGAQDPVHRGEHGGLTQTPAATTHEREQTSPIKSPSILQTPNATEALRLPWQYGRHD
jgi:hypothetical protein